METTQQMKDIAAGIAIAGIPDKFKDVMELAKSIGIVFKFQKKPELIALINNRVAEINSGAEVSSDDVKLPEIPVHDDGKPVNAVDNLKKSGNKVPVKKEESEEIDETEKVETKKKKGKEPLMSAEELTTLKARKDIADILENEKYTKSERVRKLYLKYNHNVKVESERMAIGTITKLVNIHYSFTYCVVDAYRKGLLSGKADKPVKETNAVAE